MSLLQVVSFYLLGVLLGTLNGPYQVSFSLSLLNTECNVLGNSSQLMAFKHCSVVIDRHATQTNVPKPMTKTIRIFV